jgi:hypothetical protein
MDDRKPYVEYRGMNDRKPFEYPEEHRRFREQNQQLFLDDPKAAEYAWGHLRFLKENRPDVLRDLRRSGDLNSYLSSVGEQASEMFMTLMMRYKNSQEVRELPFLEGVQALESRRHEVEETVLHDVIFQPLPDED